MDYAPSFREFSKKFGSKITIVVGGRSSTQQALFEEGVAQEFIGPPFGMKGLNISDDMCNRTQYVDTPLQYMEIQENYNGIYVDQKNLGNLSALGYVLLSFSSLDSILLMCWKLLNRTSRPVQASQPFFMIMLCIGSIIMASAMIPMSIDDLNYSENRAVV
jgi:hypothetical protein